MEEQEHKTSILIVDDSGFARKIVRQVLQEDGYTPVEANSGVAALAALDKQEFDCILTDLVMPDLDGFGLLAEIRKRGLRAPVVVLTADIQKTTRERCQELGAAAFVQKPVKPDVLRAALSGIFAGQY